MFAYLLLITSMLDECAPKGGADQLKVKRDGTKPI